MSAIDGAPSLSPQAAMPLRHVAAVAAGNALGFYDFLTYSFFAAQIGRTFFPSHDATTSLLASLATFFVGFLARPVGGIVIGILGDRRGRKPAMFLSFSLMGLGILGLSLTPSYASIGIAAPIFAILFRLIQGFALGGEVGPTTAYMIESAPAARRGFYGSLQYMTQDFAILCAGVVGVIVTNTLSSRALDEWGWRIAFILGVAIVPFGLLVRRELTETLERLPDASAAREPLRPHLRSAVLGVVLLSTGSVVSYVLLYMNTFAATTLHIRVGAAFGVTVVSGFFGVCMDPVSGWLSDRFGRKPVMIVPWLLVLVALFPAFLFMSAVRTPLALFGAVAALQILVSLGSPTVLTAITEALPSSIRSGALSVIYAFAISIFGGSTQFVVASLVAWTGSPLAPAWYTAGAIAIGFVAMLATEESAPKLTSKAR